MNAILKNILIFTLLLAGFTCKAQLSFMVKGGFHTSNIGESVRLINDGGSSLFSKITMDQHTGYHIGPMLRLEVMGTRIESGALAILDRARFNLDDPSASNLSKNIYSVDVPLLVRMKLFFLDLHIGPVKHFYLTEGIEHENYGIGYIAGLGLQIFSITIDIDFELNPDSINYELPFDGYILDVEESKHRAYFSISYQF